MADLGQVTGPVVVEFPDEFDFDHAGDVAKRLRAAIAPGAGVVVADLTTTTFCDSSGVRIMLLARDWASADNVELRLTVPPGPTLVVLKLLALDERLPIYPSLEQALAGACPGHRHTARVTLSHAESACTGGLAGLVVPATVVSMMGGDVMRTGAARGHVGHFHEAGFYGSDAQFRDLIVPFAQEGIAAGEPVIIGYDDRKSGLLRSWLTDPSAVEFIADNSLYATPARAISTYRRLFEFHLPMGAGQIRIAGDVPHAGNGGRFEGWDRYECAVNTVWQDFPVWGLCLYDTTTTPTAVLDAVERTHPRIVSASGDRHPSGRYQDLSQFQGLAPRQTRSNSPPPSSSSPAARQPRPGVRLPRPAVAAFPTRSLTTC